MRFEYKYLVPIGRIDDLRTQIQPFTRPDPFASRSVDGQYTVRSLYFDSPTFEMYNTKIDHLAHRLKVRLRGYNTGNDASPVFMEIKRKYEAPILKNRAEAPFGLVKQLLAGANFEAHIDQIKKPDSARRFLYQVFSKNLRPVVNVIYEREPYLGGVINPENDFRITFDLNLRGIPYPPIESLFEEPGARHVYPGFFILEVKFNQYCPGWVKPMLEELKLYKEPASKYVGCIEVNPLVKPERRFDLMSKGRTADGRR
jgi:hypothetical protein